MENNYYFSIKFSAQIGKTLIQKLFAKPKKIDLTKQFKFAPHSLPKVHFLLYLIREFILKRWLCSRILIHSKFIIKMFRFKTLQISDSRKQ